MVVTRERPLKPDQVKEHITTDNPLPAKMSADFRIGSNLALAQPRSYARSSRERRHDVAQCQGLVRADTVEKSTSSDRANNQSRIDRLKVEMSVPL